MKVREENGISCLDLDGVSHAEAPVEVVDFCYQYQESIPLIIICGNSSKMLGIVSKTLEAHDISFDSPRYGIIRILSFNH